MFGQSLFSQLNLETKVKNAVHRLFCLTKSPKCKDFVSADINNQEEQQLLILNSWNQLTLTKCCNSSKICSASALTVPTHSLMWPPGHSETVDTETVPGAVHSLRSWVITLGSVWDPGRRGLASEPPSQTPSHYFLPQFLQILHLPPASQFPPQYTRPASSQLFSPSRHNFFPLF